MKRDITDKSMVLFDRIDPATASVAVLGTAIDTKGAKGVMIALQPLDISDDYAVIALTGTNDIDIAIHECDTPGGDYTAIAADKYLPTGGAKKLEILPTNGLFKIGCTSNKRYIKPVVTAVTVDGITVANLLVTAIVVKEMNAVPVL